MAVASNPLLQIGTSVAASGKAQTTAASALNKVADATKDGGSSFAEVYAQEHKALPQKSGASATARPTDHLASTDKKPAVAAKQKDDKPSVAADGKSSPVAKNDKTDKAGKADKTSKADKSDTAGEADDADTVQADDATESTDVVSAKADDDTLQSDLADASLNPPQPLMDPTAAAPAPAPAHVANDPAPQPQPLIDPAQLQAATQAQAPTPAANDDFDPAADPLADLPMVRMALEQSAKDQGTTSVHAKPDTGTAQPAADASSSTSFAESMGAMVEQQKVTDSATSDSDKDGLGAIGELKGGKAADGSDNRVDDLSSRLGQLNQAVSGKAAASAATPLAQPLNMQQNGWSEGLVNRVMYLSSQNLKSADIQLHPLELGRLDIRVDVTPDQQTQITFHSAHLGVRDALESQQGRLRDMLSQQGMTQVDVNVSSQSQQQQQQQQAQAQAAQASASGRGRGGNVADEPEVSAVAEAAATQSVIGSSMVDYYA
ncbi:flagellar hook-length control protein FliK [Pseudomonas sp. RIT-PI-S]|uniref:flagellar hook-length control protein FliK n=1 Tax=Pseudomonas sp. RIT-PI-S TaxID=3035295 RepID=UPI0021DB1623|nr:flagellar hook-length control protein FliK [Pseudomonas sp. RIT-PI-S]